MTQERSCMKSRKSRVQMTTVKVQERSYTKLRKSGLQTTTVKTLSLEANYLTIHYLEDLLVVFPNISGARTVPLGADALDLCSKQHQQHLQDTQLPRHQRRG